MIELKYLKEKKHVNTFKKKYKLIIIENFRF